MTDNVNVLVRMRPLLSFQHQPAWLTRQDSLMTLNSCRDKSTREGKDVQHQFVFENIVQENSTSEQMYKKHIKDVFVSCFQKGRNVSIMAYGQTCSGKTHTILGVKQAPGIIPCVLRQIFKISHNKKTGFKVSYLQLYNQKLTDLLDKKGATGQRKIVKDSKWTYDVSNTTKQSVNCFEDAIRIVEKGQKERIYGHGQHHSTSSRSHTLFRIFVEEWDHNYESRSFVITVVDLAGSQRLTLGKQNHTQTGFINKSLFQLANVISKLSEQPHQHIPFRDSKLTRLLEPSLSGTGRTFLICCVSPSTQCYNETLSTLRLAARAKKIQLKDQTLITKGEEMEMLQQKLKAKTKQCKDLKVQLGQLNGRIKKMEKQMQDMSAKMQQRQLKGDILVLLDHQNFTLFLQDSQQQNLPDLSSLKQTFLSQLQQLYQSYTSSILKFCKGDEFILKIDEVCFMNMVLEHDKIVEYKLSIVDEILVGQEQNNQKFYVALEGYREKLIQKMRSRDELCRNLDSRFSSDCKIGQVRELPQNARCSLQRTDPRVSFSTKKQPSHKNSLHSSNKVDCNKETGSTVLTWGSKKDYRVCKGQPSPLGMTKISALRNIVSVTCGYHHTLATTEEGKLFGWGKNTQKQICPSNRESISSPIQISGVDRIRCAAAGWGHSLALNSEGKAFSWGYGKDGQLGTTQRQNQPNPTSISHPHKITSVFCGHSHSAFIDIHNDCFTFGFNQDYRLMTAEDKYISTPKRIPLRDVLTVGLGVSHSSIVTKGGQVFCGGVGTYGQLGVVLDERQAGWQKLEVPDRQFQSQSFEKICPLVQVDLFGSQNRAHLVKCGQNCTFVLNQKGQLYSFGKKGRVGHQKMLPTKILSEVDEIQCGQRHAFALKKQERKLYSWGFNLYGQANPSIQGDIQSPQLLQQLPQSQLLSLSCGSFHSTLLYP